MPPCPARYAGTVSIRRPERDRAVNAAHDHRLRLAEASVELASAALRSRSASSLRTLSWFPKRAASRVTIEGVIIWISSFPRGHRAPEVPVAP